MIATASRYAWWLGARSEFTRKVVSMTGWRLSRFGFRMLGRPSGALAWPLGLSLLVLNADDERAQRELRWVSRCLAGLVDKSGRSLAAATHIDRGGLGYAALRLHELGYGANYLSYAINLGAALQALPRSASNLIPYAAGRHEILVDTLAFVCPFFARLARMTDCPGYAELALEQLDSTWMHWKESDQDWVCHGFDSRDKRPLGLAGWGRGVAWLLMAIVDTLRELPAGHEHERWAQRGEQLLAQLQACQRADGQWPWRLDRLEETPDSSVTSLVAYALARWQQARMTDRQAFSAMLERALMAIDRATDGTGRVDQSSGEAAGIGQYSTAFGHNLWAQAPAVAADQILCRDR
jgi:unsaturated rhamnogalacturonyl hydrolase